MRTFWIILAVFYMIARFAFGGVIDSLGEYASYIFEASMVTIALALEDDRALFKIPRWALVPALCGLPFGFLAFKGAGLLGIEVPYNFSSDETVVLLLVVAPLLEEGLFRFFLWQPLGWWNRLGAWLITSALFAYSHLHSIWFVPADFAHFLYYQTAYTLALGLLCGFSVWRYRSLTASVLTHFLFNLGFYIAWLVLRA